MIEPNNEQRQTVYLAIGNLFTKYKRPIQKREIVKETGLDKLTVHVVLVWLKRWKLIHNNGKSNRKWFPVRIPRTGICWNHGEKRNNGKCGKCERIAKYTYSKKYNIHLDAVNGVIGGAK